MTGQEMRALRLQTGYSQAELGAAIGMSRETIGRMERSKHQVEKRTELALKYIALRGLEHERPLEQIKAEVAQVLDDASIRASPSVMRTEKLKKALDDWSAAGGNDAGRQLIYRAQGVIGLINVTEPTDGGWSRVLGDLAQVKLEWATVAT
jgi:DNA-binding XRE family transcriptional regulator